MYPGYGNPGATFIRNFCIAGAAGQVPGVSMTRFFVPNRGVTHQWTAKEMAAHADFVYLDMAATYQTIGSQVVRGRRRRAHSRRSSSPYSPVSPFLHSAHGQITWLLLSVFTTG